MKDSTTGTEDDCLRTCYEDTECKYVTYVYDTAANSGLCSLYKKGTTELIAQGGTYELRRDEVLSNCKRKVIMSLSGTTLGTTSPKQDDKQISTSAADEQQETRVPVTGWEYSSERNMCYRV
ncbi:hypothetical protein Y032_0019g3746 [Ancylostoma ceylanicum]|uniref:Apple domain-containing protein n=1 Tax=Ancylostoma ceylanicum TaxID=53326 RepID=A0A016V3J7_9BILA|nr:hypothetical protein Y032_0019g3746 [Ancylostoma ceylanicum]